MKEKCRHADIACKVLIINRLRCWELEKEYEYIIHSEKYIFTQTLSS